MKIILLPQAVEDLDAVQEPLLSKILNRIEILREYPELGAPMPPPFSGYRSTVVELFRVVYALEPKGIIRVAYVRNCRMRPLR